MNSTGPAQGERARSSEPAYGPLDDRGAGVAVTPVAYRERLHDYLASHVYPLALEHEGRLPDAPGIVRRLGAHGFFAPCMQTPGRDARSVPLNFRLFRVLVEELAKTRCFGLTLAVSMHVGVFLPLVARLAQDAVRVEMLHRGLRGDWLGTVAASEAEVAGSDLLGMQTTATLEAESILLNGNKHFITNAIAADYAVVFARRSAARHFTNLCAVLVPLHAQGVRTSAIDLAVMRDAGVGRIELDNLRLPTTYLLGRTQLGLQYFLQHIAVERLAGGAWAVAVAERCLEEAQQFAAGRVVGDCTLWQRSAVRQRVAEAVGDVTLLRLAVDSAIAEADRTGQVPAFTSAVVKAYVAPAMEKVIGTCLQLRGAQGFETGGSLLRLLNDFRVFGVAGGSTETMLEVVAELWAERAHLQRSGVRK